MLEIDDMGDSEAMLRNNGKLRQLGQRLIRRGIIPEDAGWGGWLGRYQKALRDAVTTLEIPSVSYTNHRRRTKRDRSWPVDPISETPFVHVKPHAPANTERQGYSDSAQF